MHVDVTRASFYAGTSRDIYGALPAEDQQAGDGHMCGKLKRSMHGARDTAQNWQRKCSQTLRDVGFVTGTASPSHFFDEARQACGLCTGR